MSDLDDLDLHSDDDRLEAGLAGPAPRPPIAGIAAAAGVLIAAGLLGWWWWSHRGRVPAAPQPVATASEPQPSAPPSSRPTPIDLPGLDESDDLLRRLAAGLVADPLWSRWLGVPSLARTFTAAVANVAEGSSPRPQLGFLAPNAGFAAHSRAGRLVIDPASYERYDPVGRAMSALNAPAAVALYAQVEPLFDDAYRELGHPEGRFRPVLSQAIQRLLEVPIVDGDVGVRPVQRARLLYELVDERLESLSPAQKHLLRMGPANVRRIQDKLKEIRSTLATLPGS